jgi:hypothetical protein
MSMKAILTISIMMMLVAMPRISHCQEGDVSSSLRLKSWNIPLYFGYAGGLNTGTSFEGCLSNNLLIGLDLNKTYFNSKNTPRGFEAGLDMPFTKIPKDHVTSINLLLGAYLPVGEKDRFRIVLEAGPGFKTYAESHFTYSPGGIISFKTNYDREFKYYHTLGLAAKARMEWLLGGIGIGLGGGLNASQYAVLPSIDAGIFFQHNRKLKTQ